MVAPKKELHETAKGLLLSFLFDGAEMPSSSSTEVMSVIASALASALLWFLL